MTIDELHDYCRYLFDKSRLYGVSDFFGKGYECALAQVMYRCDHGLSEEDLKDIADWREKHWKDEK